MADTDPKTIVERAIARGELDKLLLGEPEYCYRSRWSPAPGDTDLTELLEIVYGRLDSADAARVREAMKKALFSVVGRYEGVEPVVIAILMESRRKRDTDDVLGLPLNELAEKLRGSINAFSTKLKTDKTGVGEGMTDGRLGDLRRLSRTIEELGGPAFCDEVTDGKKWKKKWGHI